MATSDYADRWAAREQVIKDMGADEKRAYAIGLSHVYTDVFAAFHAGMVAGDDLSAVLARVNAQWDDVRATQIVRGAL